MLYSQDCPPISHRLNLLERKQVGGRSERVNSTTDSDRRGADFKFLYVKLSWFDPTVGAVATTSPICCKGQEMDVSSTAPKVSLKGEDGKLTVILYKIVVYGV